MKNTEKAELLKSTIEHLYSKEGRSISYISRLLEINRKVLSSKIHEWNLPVAPHIRYMKPSTRKCMNRNKLFIISQLNNDVTIKNICETIKIDKKLIKLFADNDKEIKTAYDNYITRKRIKHLDCVEKQKNNSNRNYDFKEYPNEEWKSILGYEDYYISNYGRVKKLNKRLDSFYLITQSPNKYNGRL